MTFIIKWADPEKHWNEFESLFCGNEWPYHSQSQVSPKNLQERKEEGEFSSPDSAVVFLELDSKLIGLVVIHGICDACIEIDLRIDSTYRGKGFGKRALKELGKLVFERFENCARIEGNTREDNILMRRAFRSAGWVNEAFYRDAGFDSYGNKCGVLVFGITRQDWITGVTTPIQLD